MCQFVGHDIEIGHGINRHDLEALYSIADFKAVLHSVFAPWDIMSELMCLTSGLHHLHRCCFLLLHLADVTSSERWTEGLLG